MEQGQDKAAQRHQDAKNSDGGFDFKEHYKRLGIPEADNIKHDPVSKIPLNVASKCKSFYAVKWQQLAAPLKRQSGRGRSTSFGVVEPGRQSLGMPGYVHSRT